MSLTSAHTQWGPNYQNHMAASDLKKISISLFYIGHIQVADFVKPLLSSIICLFSTFFFVSNQP